MTRGAFLAIFASFVFSIMNALVKTIADSIPTAEIVFFRSSIGCVAILILMWHSKVALSNKDVPLLILRGTAGALYLLCYFYSLAHLPLADASMLAYLSPFFSILLSLWILREPLAPRTHKWLGLVIIGALLIIRPHEYASFNLASLVGVVGAFFAALAYLSVSKLSKTHHAYEIVFYFLLIASLMSVVLMWGHFIWPNAFEWLILISIALVSLLGLVALTQAFASENMAVVAVVRYIGIVFNIGWGWLFWAEWPHYLTLIGGALVLYACLRLGMPTAKPKLNRG